MFLRENGGIGVQISCDGMVVRQNFFGDSSKYVVLLTDRYGKLSASAKGARRMKSALLAPTQPMCYAHFELSERNGKYTVISADRIESFHTLRQDIKKLAFAEYAMQIAEYVSGEGEDCADILRLLLNTLYLTAKPERESDQIKPVYELRLLALSGYMPDIWSCAGCGQEKMAHGYFRLNQGDLICDSCRAKLPVSELHGVMTPVSAAVIEAMRYVLSTPLNKAFAFRLKGGAAKDFADTVQAYMLTQLEHSFKTLSFYRSLDMMIPAGNEEKIELQVDENGEIISPCPAASAGDEIKHPAEKETL